MILKKFISCKDIYEKVGKEGEDERNQEDYPITNLHFLNVGSVLRSTRCLVCVHFQVHPYA